MLFPLGMQPEARHYAQPYDPSPDSRTSVRPALRPQELLLVPAPDALSAAALAAESAARPGAELAPLWQGVLERRLVYCAEGSTPFTRYAVARVDVGGSLSLGPLSRIETAVLVRVLSGEQQKLVASELGIACSTASKWYTTALAKVRLGEGPIPLPLILAAQAWVSGKILPVDARSTSFDHDGARHVVVSVPRPTVDPASSLTPAEREVAGLVTEGESRWEIAAHRDTSALTVACQIRGIFSKFRLTGRYALIRRATELGWFR